MAKYKQLAKDLLDIVVWMSGSTDFAPEGKAYEGWKKVQPTVNEALEILK